MRQEETISTYKFPESVHCVAFSPDGKVIVTGGGPLFAGGWIMWDAHTGKRLAGKRDHRQSIWCIAFSPDGKVFATGGGAGDARLWDASTGKQLAELTGHQVYDVKSLSFSADSKTLASAGGDNTVRIWEVPSGKQKAKFVFDERSWERHGIPPEEPEELAAITYAIDKPVKKIYEVAFFPDGKTLATAVRQRDVYLLDITTGKFSTINTSLKDGVACSVAISPDGSVLAVGGGYKSRKIILWDMIKNQEKAVLEGHSWAVLSLAFSSDGKKLASASLNNAHEVTTGVPQNVGKIWDVAIGKEQITLEEHKSGICWIAFSPDGETVATISHSSVKLWDVATGKNRR